MVSKETLLLISLNVEEIKNLYTSGLTQKEIATKYFTNVETVYRFMKKHGIKARSNTDAQTSTIKLTEQQIDKLWSLYDTGHNREAIAIELGITIHAIRKEIEGNCRGKAESIRLHYKNKTIPLTYQQEQLILGSLLGDASLTYRRDNYDFQVGQCLEQREYLEHKANILNTNVSSYIKGDGSFSAGKVFYKTNYNNKYELEKVYETCFLNRRKTVNSRWVEKLDALGIAYWFMDDGSSYVYKDDGAIGGEVATCSFSRSEIELLQNKLASFNIKTTINKHKSVYKGKVKYFLKLRLSQNSIDEFMDLIEPTVLSIPCMTYKIKRRER